METATDQLDLIALEVVMFLILLSVQKLAFVTSGERLNLADKGPWWSVLYHRIWLACHIPGILVSAALTAAAKKAGVAREVGLPLILFPVVNYLLIMLVKN